MTIGSMAHAAAATDLERGVQSATAQSDLITLINLYRSSNGVRQLAPNVALASAAAWMASDMAAKNYMSHISSDGRSPAQRMSAFGYPAGSPYTAENLGAGYATAGAMLSGWQASSAHNAILLSPNFDAIGIGLGYNANSTYKWYWAADFGGPGGAATRIVAPSSPQPSTARAQLAAPAPRGSESENPDQTLDPEVAAEAARAAASLRIDERRMTHLFAVLERLGEI
jgi:hypothetical protein